MSTLDSCVETDCAPAAMNFNDQNLSDKLRCMNLHSDERTESGFEPSLKSHEEEELKTKLAGHCERVPGGMSNARKPMNDTSCKQETPYESVDEGFFSESITDADRLPFETVDSSGCEKERENLGRLAYSQDEDGDTSLHMAIIQLMTEVAFNCIRAAPSPSHLNLVNNLLQTPLHLAVLTKQVQVVRKLMTSGAQVDVRDLHGNTPLHIACREGLYDIVRMLLQPIYYEETQENVYDIPFQLIPQDLEAKNYEGLTCLHLAAQGCHIKVLGLLQERGANINVQDGKSGRTVLHYAAEMDNVQLLNHILQHPYINIDCTTYGGMTPIALAHGRNHVEIVSQLVKSGADDEFINDEEDTDEDMNEEMLYDDLCISGRRIW